MAVNLPDGGKISPPSISLAAMAANLPRAISPPPDRSRPPARPRAIPPAPAGGLR